MPASRRLPGLRIDTAPPAAAQALPRMDVAVLVGFASTGPLHRPVAVESVVQYAAVFGADAPLAWDAERGERVLAHLGPAVRAFFANGGRRCWVLRVARSAAAEALWRGITPDAAADLPDVARANRFALPGVLACQADASLAPALASARCEGSWSDGVQIVTALTQRSLRVETLTAPDSPPASRLLLRARQALQAGELILLGDPASVCAYALVTDVAAAVAAGGPLQASLHISAAFERVTAAGSPPNAVSGSLDIAGVVQAATAAWTAPGLIAPVLPLPATVRAGHWARWQGGGQVVWLRVDAVDAQGTPGNDPAFVTATLTGPAWRALPPVLPAALAGVLRAQVQTLELQATRGAEATTLSGLGLSPAAPDAWWQQLNDDAYHAPRDRLPAKDGAAVPTPARSAAPRFPLAADTGAQPMAWIPLGVEPVYGMATGALPQTATALQRDGLARFDAELFLDPELDDSAVDALLPLADTVRLMREQPRPLFGLHAALAIGEAGVFGEASLLAVPDAIHTGWLPRTADPAPAVAPAALPTPSAWLRHRGACADIATAPADAPLIPAPDFSTFIDCGVRLLATPLLRGPLLPVAPGAYRLNWTDSEPGAGYVLLESTQADASDAREVYRGTATAFVASARNDGSYHYQVHAELGDLRSADSNSASVQVRSSDYLQRAGATLDDAFEAQWLRVHRAALRLCAATGELFAVLAMPRHFRTQQAVRYASRLRGVRGVRGLTPATDDLQALAYGEAHALSYGALYHPWLQTAAGTAQASAAARVRAVPPDGAALGTVAQRAALRGAWVAPANQVLRDVLGTVLQPDAAEWQALQDAQINLLRTDPRGLLAMSADTLALDTELRAINVRRLLTLLRRLALRRGTAYVFEPLGPVLRRAVQRSFTELLTDLFRRGAFAGATPEQAFQVRTDGGVGNAADDDAGRFIVELRVAPSLPLRFIGVQLAQSGERLTVAEVL